MIHLIVAKSENNVIGHNNQLIWHLPNDLKHFKEITTGHPIIMGRKTFESIGRALPNRKNIVITRNKDYKIEDVEIAYSLEEAIGKAKKTDENIFIIGGGKIYEQAMIFADILEITEVHEQFEGDTFFPEIDPKVWREKSRINYKKDQKNKFDHSFVRYERILNPELKAYH